MAHQNHVLVRELGEGVGKLLLVLRLVVGRVAPDHRRGGVQPGAEQPHGSQERRHLCSVTFTRI